MVRPYDGEMGIFEDYMGVEEEMSYAEKLEKAVKEMIAFVEAGGEYPDAQWRASQKHKMTAEALASAYDAYTKWLAYNNKGDSK